MDGCSENTFDKVIVQLVGELETSVEYYKGELNWSMEKVDTLQGT